jgi:hypothetical protein
MNLPFDFEDIVGVAVADTLRRVGRVLVCVVASMLVSGLAIAFGEIVASMEEPSVSAGDVLQTVAPRALGLGLAPFTCSWGLLYLPLWVGCGFYLIRAEGPIGQGLTVCVAAIALLQVLSASDPAWFGVKIFGTWFGPSVADPERLRWLIKSVAVPMTLGFAGAIWFLAWTLERRARVRAEVHLMGIRGDNDRRRLDLGNEAGIEIADAGFVSDEELPR